MRIIFVGENWFGSCARACSAALRRLGCDVLDIDTQTFFPQWKAPGLRLLRKGLLSRITADFNLHLLDQAATYQPDMLLAFKGVLIDSSTLRSLRKREIALYNYYPDRVIFARGTELERTLPEYDCVFDTKRSWDGDMNGRLHLRDRILVPHGYDPDVHRPANLSQADWSAFGCPVTFIGTHTERKETLLHGLIRRLPSLALRIYGNYWNRCRAAALQPYISGTEIRGEVYAKAIAASKINLAIMGVSDDALDETTTRTFEIPACGGFMLHERSQEALLMFEENSEMACFSSIDELADKVQFFLQHESEAKRIADAGYRRAVPHYSYEERMRSILRYHREQREERSYGSIAS